MAGPPINSLGSQWKINTKHHPRPPVVMTKNEIKRVLPEMGASLLLMAKMLQNSGCYTLAIHSLARARRFFLEMSQLSAQRQAS
jgi:hypothetical protein